MTDILKYAIGIPAFCVLAWAVAWAYRRARTAAGAEGRPWFDSTVIPILLAAGLAALAAALSDPPAGLSEPPAWQAPAALALAALWLAAWCVVTDGWTRVRGLRFLAILLAAIGLHYAGVRIEWVKLPLTQQYVHVGLWSIPVLTLWAWFCAYLFARAAAIPGTVYGVGAVAWLTLTAVCLMQPEATGPASLALSLSLALACTSLFLVTLGEPRRGGTAGPYVLGFLLATGSVMGMLKLAALQVAVLPSLLISVPFFGAAYSYVADFRSRHRGIALTQRRQHLHQLLLRRGYAPRHVALLLVALSAWCGVLALLMLALDSVPLPVKLTGIVALLAAGCLACYVALRCLPREAEQHDAIRLLGVRITPVSMDVALERVRGFIADGTPRMILTSDASGMMQAREDSELRDIMDEADLVTPDGQGVVLASRLLDMPVAERVSGVDMVQKLCEVAAEVGRSVFLLGGAEGVAEKTAENLCAAVPGLQVAGVQHGYFGPEEEPEIIRVIREAKPAVLFVAFGIPKQEKWISAHRHELGVPVCIGVGGSFDVISGRLKRAPLWVRRCGLEWLFRVLQEPKRLPRLKALPRIAWLAVAAMLKGETGEPLPGEGRGDTV